MKSRAVFVVTAGCVVAAASWSVFWRSSSRDPDSSPVREADAPGHVERSAGMSGGAGPGARSPHSDKDRQLDAAVRGGSECPDARADADAVCVARHLREFTSESPDVLGWNSFLGDLARRAVLDEASVRENDAGATVGEFEIQNSALRIAFEIASDQSKIELRGEAASASDEPVGYKAELGWSFEGGRIAEARGIVQFLARDAREKECLASNVVGCLYEIDEEDTQVRVMHARIREGRYEVHVPRPDERVLLGQTDIGPAYDWAHRLDDVRRVRAADRGAGEAGR